MHTDMATHFGLVSKMNEFVVSRFLEALQEEEKGEDDDQNKNDDDDDNDDQNEEDPLFEDGIVKKDKEFFKTDDERQLMLNVLLDGYIERGKPFRRTKCGRRSVGGIFQPRRSRKRSGYRFRR